MITEKRRVQSVAASRAVPAARTEGLVTTEANDEVLVYDQERHHIHHLNRASAAIWRLCDGRRDRAELARLASDVLGGPVGDDAVAFAVQELSDAKLLVSPVNLGDGASRQSRRAFMRRAAVAGAVAVPAIVSMTAPASAASKLACGAVCTNSGQCPGSFGDPSFACNNCGWLDCNGNIQKTGPGSPSPSGVSYCTCPPGQAVGCPMPPPLDHVCPAAATNNTDNQNAPLNQPQTNSLIEQPTDATTGTDNAAPTQPPAPQDTQPAEQTTQDTSLVADPPTPTPTDPPPAAADTSSNTNTNTSSDGTTVDPNGGNAPVQNVTNPNSTAPAGG